MTIEVLLQSFICIIYAELLKTVPLQIYVASKSQNTLKFKEEKDSRINVKKE
jgi:hypothetical protein